MMWHTILSLALLPLRSEMTFSQSSTDTVHVCLAPTSAQIVGGNTDAAIGAVQATFTSFLTGPSLAVTPLNARLASQVREEAKASGCPYLLLTSIKQERRQGSSILGRAVSSGVETGAWAVIGSTASTATRVAAGATAGAAVAAGELAATVRTKDELTLSYRVENTDGRLLLEKSEKRKASSDGEDLLTPLVEHAAEAIATLVKSGR